MGREMYRSILEVRLVNPNASMDCKFFFRLNEDALRVS